MLAKKIEHRPASEANLSFRVEEFSDISNWKISDYFLLIYTKISGKDDECPKESLYSAIKFVLLKHKRKAIIYLIFDLIRLWRCETCDPETSYQILHSLKEVSKAIEYICLWDFLIKAMVLERLCTVVGSLLRSVFKLQTYLSELFCSLCPMH